MIEGFVIMGLSPDPGGLVPSGILWRPIKQFAPDEKERDSLIARWKKNGIRCIEWHHLSGVSSAVIWG